MWLLLQEIVKLREMLTSWRGLFTLFRRFIIPAACRYFLDIISVRSRTQGVICTSHVQVQEIHLSVGAKQPEEAGERGQHRT